MVLEPEMVRGYGFESPLYNLNIDFPFMYLKVHKKLRLVPHDIGTHVREGAKSILFMRNPNLTSLSF